MTQRLTYGIFCDIIFSNSTASLSADILPATGSCGFQHAGFEFVPFFLLLNQGTRVYKSMQQNLVNQTGAESLWPLLLHL